MRRGRAIVRREYGGEDIGGMGMGGRGKESKVVDTATGGDALQWAQSWKQQAGLSDVVRKLHRRRIVKHLDKQQQNGVHVCFCRQKPFDAETHNGRASRTG
jgi:hypothetical protein